MHEYNNFEKKDFVNTWLPVNYRTTGGGPALAPDMVIYKSYL
jgi:hypothetical protein